MGPGDEHGVEGGRPFDWWEVDAYLRKLAALDPNGRLHMRFNFGPPPDWWAAMHPDDLVQTLTAAPDSKPEPGAGGWRVASFASKPTGKRARGRLATWAATSSSIPKVGGSSPSPTPAAVASSSRTGVRAGTATTAPHSWPASATGSRHATKRTPSCARPGRTMTGHW